MKMERRIIIDSESREKIQKIFGVSNVTVWKALSYKNDNELSRKIRHVALKELGGVEINGALPEMETYHHADGTMVQTFGNRVKIYLYEDMNRVAVLVDGEVRRTEDNLSISEFMGLQGEAYKLAKQLQRG